MAVILIFLWIYAAMLANSFWEAYVEGGNPWGKRKLGWTLKITKKITLPAYHFYLFVVMWPLLLTLPLVIYGWDFKLAGILASAYVTGLIVEDFGWFVVNPAIKFPRDFNSKFANFYPWIKIGKFEIPAFYVGGIIIALLSWFFIWR